MNEPNPMVFDYAKFNKALNEHFGVRMFTDFLGAISKEFIGNIERAGIDFDDCQVAGYDWPHEQGSVITLRLARFGAGDVFISLGARATNLIAAHIADCLEDL